TGLSFLPRRPSRAVTLPGEGASPGGTAPLSTEANITLISPQAVVSPLISSPHSTPPALSAPASPARVSPATTGAVSSPVLLPPVRPESRRAESATSSYGAPWDNQETTEEPPEHWAEMPCPSGTPDAVPPTDVRQRETDSPEVAPSEWQEISFVDE